jgi:hypothetical protein
VHTSTNELLEHNLSIYPNPVINGQLIIENGQLNANVQIIDLAGKIVINSKLNNGKLDVSTLASGTYIVKSENRMAKIIINN